MHLLTPTGRNFSYESFPLSGSARSRTRSRSNLHIEPALHFAAFGISEAEHYSSSKFALAIAPRLSRMEQPWPSPKVTRIPRPFQSRHRALESVPSSSE